MPQQQRPFSKVNSRSCEVEKQEKDEHWKQGRDLARV